MSATSSHTRRSAGNLFTKRREPFQFMLWLGMGGSAIVFLFLLIAYIVRKDNGAWQEIALPRIFWLSTFTIGLSSLTLHWANKAFRNESFLKYRFLVGSTLLLGFVFMVMQGWGWQSMLRLGIRPSTSLAGGFVYLISGLHLLHILLGVVFLLIIFIDAIRRISYIDSFIYSVNPPNQLKLRLVLPPVLRYQFKVEILI
ncbi:MAG: heme-copper oxidase subunit III [Spirosomataceae bacterium]